MQDFIAALRAYHGLTTVFVASEEMSALDWTCFVTVVSDLTILVVAGVALVVL